MNPIYRFVTMALIVACMAVACSPQRTVTLDDLLGAENMEEFSNLAMRVKAQGKEGIPLLLAVIDHSLATKYKLFSYGKLNTCLRILHDLAADGIYTVESVPVLVRTIEEQIYIGDTLVTARILETITGVDVGYDSDFVSNYKVEDEERRKEMISGWRNWYATNAGGADR